MHAGTHHAALHYRSHLGRREFGVVANSSAQLVPSFLFHLLEARRLNVMVGVGTVCVRSKELYNHCGTDWFLEAAAEVTSIDIY